MKYMLMMTGSGADFDWYASWSKQDLQTHTAFMRTFSKELKESGTFVSAEGVAFPNQAKIVRAGSGGEPVTDGVFPESKEFLAGYFIVDVESPEEAYRLAARISAAPGNKTRGNQPIEVRQVMSGPPEEFSRVISRKATESKGNETMKYMMMMSFKTDKESMSKGIMTWPQQDIQTHIAFMMGLNKDLKASGEFVAAEGLAWPDQAKLVRAGADGTPVTDGVFPESKEFLIGYWIIEVESPERAYQIAARASAAPGLGGAPLNMPIEVRQVLSGPPKEFQ